MPWTFSVFLRNKNWRKNPLWNLWKFGPFFKAIRETLNVLSFNELMKNIPFHWNSRLLCPLISAKLSSFMTPSIREIYVVTDLLAGKVTLVFRMKIAGKEWMGHENMTALLYAYTISCLFCLSTWVDCSAEWKLRRKISYFRDRVLSEHWPGRLLQSSKRYHKKKKKQGVKIFTLLNLFNPKRESSLTENEDISHGTLGAKNMCEISTKC